MLAECACVTAIALRPHNRNDGERSLPRHFRLSQRAITPASDSFIAADESSSALDVTSMGIRQKLGQSRLNSSVNFEIEISN